MDEIADLAGHGLALLINEGEGEALTDGCRIRDVQGNIHTVDRVGSQEGLTYLLLKHGDAEYFGRLFRNIKVDATLFTLVPEGA